MCCTGILTICKEKYFSNRCTTLECNHSQCIHVVHLTQLCKEQYFSIRCTALECNHSQCISVVHQTQLCKEQYFSKRCAVLDITTRNVLMWYTRPSFTSNNTSVKGVQCSFVSVLKVTLCSVYCGCTLYTINY